MSLVCLLLPVDNDAQEMGIFRYLAGMFMGLLLENFCHIILVYFYEVILRNKLTVETVINSLELFFIAA